LKVCFPDLDTARVHSELGELEGVASLKAAKIDDRSAGRSIGID